MEPSQALEEPDYLAQMAADLEALCSLESTPTAATPPADPAAVNYMAQLELNLKNLLPPLLPDLTLDAGDEA